jgi:hypothetical protein
MQVENGANETSLIPTLTTTVTRAEDGFQEIETPYPTLLDLLGSGVTRGHIGQHPIASRETAGMSRLDADGGELREWSGELLLVS